MDTLYYLDQFEQATSRLDKIELRKREIEVAVGEILDSVFLKLYKKSWATPSVDPLTATSRVFFSVWVNDAAIGKQKILYNIHALKLHQLKNYSIQSRKFADIFRQGFKKVESNWENVRVDFGPLTLMEGWVSTEGKNLQDIIAKLANNFLTIEHQIDETFAHFKK